MLMVVSYYRERIHNRISKGEKTHLPESGGIPPQAFYVLLKKTICSTLLPLPVNCILLLHRKATSRLKV